MNFIDKLERKFGKYAIKNLMLYIVLGNAFIFLFTNLRFASVSNFTFYLPAILRGEVWRLVTFLFIPQTTDLLWFIFATMLYYFVGNALEQVWGSFKFNLYYFTGALGTIAITSLFSFIVPIEATSHYINLSLFLGFATLFPNMQFRLYFFIPVKAKYLGILYFVLLAYEVVRGGVFVGLLVVVSLINYFLFFGVPAVRFYSQKRRNGYTKSASTVSYKNIPKGEKPPVKVAFHKCHVCGKTELDDPDMEFRYCSSCNGNYEYCMDHLKNHEHVK